MLSAHSQRHFTLARKEGLVRHHFVALLRSVLTILLTIPTWAAEPSVRALVKAAEKAEKSGNIVEAARLYNQAAAKGSANGAARSRELTARIARESLPAAPVSAAGTGAAAPSVASVAGDSAEVLEGIFGRISDRELREAREMLPPPELALPGNPFMLDLQEEPEKIWLSVGRLLGLEVVFDGEYPPGGKPVRFRCAEQSARQVLHGLSAATGSFVVVLGPRRIMVVKDTTQKRQEREPTVAVVLTLPDPTSTQELQEAARAVQQVMEIQKFAIDNTRHMVLMRDRVSKVRPAQMLFEQLLGARPAVVIEMELYEMRATRTTEFGIGLPTSSKLFWLSRFLNNDPDKVDAGAPLATLGAGNGLIGMTIADATVTATALKSFGTSVQRAFVQSVNGQAAQLVLGEKYPILTGSFSGSTNTDGSILALPPSFQFENLGLTMKVTPFVHDTEEMTLEVEAEFKLLTGAEINGIPILANRKFTSRVRMRDGQWALLGGLAQDSTTFNSSGIPGLMQMPVLGPLLRTNTREGNEGAVMLLLKPRLLGAGTDLTPGPIFLGAEGRPAMVF